MKPKEGTKLYCKKCQPNRGHNATHGYKRYKTQKDHRHQTLIVKRSD